MVSKTITSAIYFMNPVATKVFDDEFLKEVDYGFGPHVAHEFVCIFQFRT
jgi:hypothetical protein